MRAALWWTAVFLGAGLVAPTAVGRWLNDNAAALARHLPAGVHHQLQTLWPLGGPVMTALVLLILCLRHPVRWRRAWTAWAAFGGCGVVEVLLKHFALGTALAWARHPAAMGTAALLHSPIRTLRTLLDPARAQLLLPGMFPSGHVLRLTLVAAYLTDQGNRPLAALGAVLGSLWVVGVGAHTATDAIGGSGLALAALALTGRLRPAPAASRGPAAPAPAPPAAAP